MRIKINVDLEAKNCPFCGKPPVFYFGTYGFSSIKVYIKCPEECASKDEEIKPDKYGCYCDVEAACKRLIKKWNTRAKE